MRVKLHAQPFQVLLLLLERPGELLTREEICRELWPDGTFVDYEHGVNSAVNRIREALGDKASNPRFIETLARRGYRFVAPVERIADAGGQRAGREGPADEADCSSMTAADGASRPRALPAPEDLPKSPHHVVQTLVRAAAADVSGLLCGSAGEPGGDRRAVVAAAAPDRDVLMVLIVTAAVLIPVRAFLLCAVLFHAPGLRSESF